MKRMCLAVLLAVSSLQGYGYDFYAADLNGRRVYYEKTSTTTVSVTYYNYSSANGYNYGSVAYSNDYAIPSTVTNSGVTYTVTAIGDNAFRNTSVKSVSIPATVESIGESAFQSCNSLTSVTFATPGSLNTIGSSAFWGTPSLTGWSIPDGVTTIGLRAFCNCGAPASPLSIPASVLSIGQEAFSAGSSGTPVTSVRFEDSDISLESGYNVFGRSLQSAYIGRNITYKTSSTDLSSVLFYSPVASSTDLTDVTISEHVTTIPKALFYRCTGLTSIHIPHSVTSVDDSAFDGCTGLTSVIVDAATPPVATGDNVFNSTTYTKATLYVPAGTLTAYKAADTWQKFLKIASEMHLKDGETYDMAGSALLTDITYTRTFSNTNWQALYVPFSMEYADWATDFDVCRINDVHQWDDNDDGETDRTAIEAFYMPEGSTTTANVPYLIRAKSKGEKVLRPTNKTIYASLTPEYTVSSWTTLFTFQGTYTTIPNATVKANGYYVMGGGSLHPLTTDDNLSSFRWLMKVTDRDGVPKDISEVKLIVFGEDGVETSVDMPVSQPARAGVVYDLSGRRVEKPIRGIYVKNGKKVFVR